MKELLNKKAKMLELMLDYIERDNPMYHNILIRIDEINRILKEIEDNENNDVELPKQVTYKAFSEDETNSILKNMISFLESRKADFTCAISLNKCNVDWWNEYQDYMTGKINMCDEAICQFKRLIK